MIKLTRESLIKVIQREQVEICVDLSQEDISDYFVKCFSEKLKEKNDLLLELFTYPIGSDFYFKYNRVPTTNSDVSAIYQTEHDGLDLNPDSMEACEVEIPDEDDVTDGISLKCMEHPDTESPEYLKSVIREHVADADRREEKIELLNKMIVDLSARYKHHTQEIDESRDYLLKQMQEKDKEITRLNGVIMYAAEKEAGDIEINRLQAEIKRLNIIINDNTCELIKKGKEIEYLKSCLSQYSITGIVRERYAIENVPCSSDSPTSGG